MKDAHTCEHPVRMTEADGVCGWRVRMTCAYTCEHRLNVSNLIGCLCCFSGLKYVLKQHNTVFISKCSEQINI